MRLQSIIKRMINRMGYEVTRPGAHPRTLSDALQVLPAIPTTVIDVGVADGTPELYAAFPAARLLLIEPLKEWEPDLRRIAQERDALYELVAAGARRGEVTIGMPENLLNAGVGSAGAPRTVPVEAVDDVVARLGVTGPFVLKIDVEGDEVSVLEGASATLADSIAVVVEMITSAPIARTLPYLYDHGFVLSDIAYPTYWDGRLAHLDGVFLRADA